MTFLLDPYAARSCPVKTFNAFDPGTPKPEKPLDESLLEAFSGGSEFRDSMLEALCRATDVVDLRGERNTAETLDAMDAGAPVIVGGALPADEQGHRVGSPDALVRGADRPGGRPGYWPLRVKPYRLLEKQRNAKELRTSRLVSPTVLEPLPGYRFRSYRQGGLLELAHHWRLLQACGRSAATPVVGSIGFDDHNRGMIVWVPLELRFLRTFSRTSANGHRLRSALERYDHEHGFRVHVAQQAMTREADDPRPPAVRPIRVPECEWCAWWETCRPRMDDDDISLRISKTPLDVRELQTLMGLGITTVSQLADADVEALLPDYLPVVLELSARSGDDLLISFDNSNGTDLIIKDYFARGEGALVGMQNNGELYRYPVIVTPEHVLAEHIETAPAYASGAEGAGAAGSRPRSRSA